MWFLFTPQLWGGVKCNRSPPYQMGLQLIWLCNDNTFVMPLCYVSDERSVRFHKTVLLLLLCEWLLSCWILLWLDLMCSWVKGNRYFSAFSTSVSKSAFSTSVSKSAISRSGDQTSYVLKLYRNAGPLGGGSARVGVCFKDEEEEMRKKIRLFWWLKLVPKFHRTRLVRWVCYRFWDEFPKSAASS